MSVHENILSHSKEKEACLDLPHVGKYNKVSGRSNLRPRLFTVLAWFFILVTVVGLSAKLVCLSSKVEEQRQLTEINLKLLQKLLSPLTSSHEIPSISLAGPDQVQIAAILQDRSNTQNEISTKNGVDVSIPGRTKRRAPSGKKRRRKNSGFRGPCHLEGKGGPNIISERGVPRQKPRSNRECILWKEPDTERPSYCLMDTVNDESGYGIRYITIGFPGFYYIYSQMTYETDAWTETGHSVVLSYARNGGHKTLLTAKAPWKKTSGNYTAQIVAQDSRYTAGVFYLHKGDRLAVYPLKPMHKFIMTESSSFFGAMYVGDFYG